MSSTNELLRRIEALERDLDDLRRVAKILEPPNADAASVAVSPVKLTAKTDDTTYTGNVYGNGTDQAATESAVTVRVEGMAFGETLPNAVTFDAIKRSWPTIGGSGRTEYWTIIAPPRYV